MDVFLVAVRAAEVNSRSALSSLSLSSRKSSESGLESADGGWVRYGGAVEVEAARRGRLDEEEEVVVVAVVVVVVVVMMSEWKNGGVGGRVGGWKGRMDGCGRRGKEGEEDFLNF